MDGNKKVKGIKRHVLTCSLGFVLATLVTAANVHDTAAAGLLLDRAAAEGWTPRRVKVDGIYVGARMAQAAAPHGIEVQVSTRERDVKGFKPLPVRWRIEGTFGTLTQPISPPHTQPGAEYHCSRGCRHHRQLPPPDPSL